MGVLALYATMASPCSVVALKWNKCDHVDSKHIMTSMPNRSFISHLFEELHPPLPKGYNLSTRCRTDITAMAASFELQGPALQLGDIIDKFGVKVIEFTCQPIPETECARLINVAAEEATKTAMNAFEVLMSGRKSFPDKRTASAGVKIGTGISRKDELYNKLFDDFLKAKGRALPKDSANTDGSYILQVLSNALWYLTNQHCTINSASQHKKVVLPIPTVFENYQGFNDVKRKRLKSLPLDVEGLYSHSQALYSILMKPIMNSSPAWMTAATDIRDLADCLAAYSQHLLTQNETVKKIRT